MDSSIKDSTSEKSRVAPDLSLKGRYDSLSVDRFVFLQRARDASKLTIPSVVPPEGHSSATKLSTPWQGLGARGVNNLAAKILAALFPTNEPFFRAQLDPKLAFQLNDADKSDFEVALEQIEKFTTAEFEDQSFRPSLFEALKHLIIGGNILLYFPESGGLKVFHLDQYVTKRDPMGTVLEIIVREELSPASLPDDQKAILKGRSKTHEKTIFRYTGIKKTAKGYEARQELEGIVIPGSEFTYPSDAPAWLALRWTKVDGEDYGRGYVEEYQGDLQALESLSQAIVEGSAAAAKVLFLVNPAGSTSAKTLDESPNGAIREGNAQDVTCLQMEKYNDFRVALETIKDISERLSYAFLLNSSIQRNGERVTAEEIRYMAQELEGILGGVYSLLSQELQLPLVRRLMAVMSKQQKLPKLPKDGVRLAIVTGLQALGRGSDLEKLQQLLGIISPLGPQVIAQFLDPANFIKRTGTALGIDMNGLVRKPEEVQAQAQQQQAQATASQLGPEVVKQAGQYMTKHGGLPAGMNPNQSQGAPSGPQ